MSDERETFEQRLSRVQAMIDGIEGGKMLLEDAVKSYEEGMKTLDGLDRELSEMKRRITVLQGDRETEMKLNGEDE